MSTFEPLEMSFQDGSERISAALSAAGIALDSGILTSRDPRVAPLREALKVARGPETSDIWQLPVTLRNALVFVSVLQPNVAIPEHRHPEHAVFRLVITGSIVHEGTELGVGDWMYVPKGHPYAFQAGPNGAVLFYPHGE
jgi:hypothetical protein